MGSCELDPRPGHLVTRLVDRLPGLEDGQSHALQGRELCALGRDCGSEQWVVGVVEHDGLLGRKVAEEGHVGDAGGAGHFLDTHLVEPPFGEQTEGLSLEAMLRALALVHIEMLVTNIKVVESFIRPGPDSLNLMS